jgi:hypothetical protein
MRTFAILASAIALAGSAGAAAPDTKAALVEAPMQVHVVRSAHPGCEPQCTQWIAAQGKIVPDTAARFKKVLGQLGERKLPIFVDSGGGAVNEALVIGRLVRAKGLDVAVTRTELVPCAADDAACRKAKAGGELRGLARATLSKCASSCAFILAGGTRRLVGPGIGVGVHQITTTMRKYLVWTRRSFGGPVETRKTLVSERRVGQKNAQTQSTYADIRQFLAEMDIGADLMPLMTSVPYYDIHWLTRAELQATHLATHFINGEELATGIPEPTSAPAPSTPAMGHTVPDFMRYGRTCENSTACEKGAAAKELWFNLPGYVPKAPPAAAPDAPVVEHSGEAAQEPQR